MRTRFKSAVLALFVLVLTACNAATPGADAAATVNGEDISRDVLERIVRAQLDQQGQELESLSAEERAEVVGPLQRDILTSLIRFRVIAAVAESEGIEVSDDRLQEIRDEEVEAAGGEDAYADLVATTGLTDEEFTDLVIADVVRRELLNESVAGDVSDEELREAYESQIDTRFTTRTVRHVLVETEEEADEARAEIEGGADFGEVAQERSQDPGSGPEGGELPPAARGQFVPAFDEAVWDAEIGELVGPIETDFGFHVLEVLSEDTVAFEDAEAELRQELGGGQSNELLQGLLADAYDDAEIEVASDLGRWDPEQQQVVAADAVGDGTSGGGVEAPGDVPADAPTEGEPEPADQ